MRGWIAIPYLGGRDGHVVQLRFRCPHDHDHKALFHSKYMTMAGDPARVYNVRALHRAGDTIHIAEGEFDAMVLNQIGLPAVAVPGAANWNGKSFHLFSGFSRVWLWGDPDEAGMELVNKATRSLRSAKAVRLRDGDVTDIYMKHGAEALYELIGGRPE